MNPLKAALAVAILIIICQSQSFSQTKHPVHKSIISTRMEILYFKHNDSSSLEDQQDTLKIPVVSDKYPRLKKALSFENIGDSDGLDSAKATFAGCACGITSMDYEITYEGKDIISLKVFTEGMGAYPSSSTQWLTYNIHTGEHYSIKNEVNTAGLQWLFKSYKALLRKRLAEDREYHKKDTNETQEEYTRVYNEEKESIDTLSLNGLISSYVFVGTRGITFTTEGILPHVIQALEPDRDWFIPYNRLRKYKQPHALVIK